MSDSNAMYRNRAKAAHQLQSQQQASAAAAVAPPAAAGGGWNPAVGAPAAQVPFFNPTAYQNGAVDQQNFYSAGKTVTGTLDVPVSVFCGGNGCNKDHCG